MEPIVAREGLLFGIKALGQDARQLVHRLAADLEDDQLEHVVLHGRVARRLPVPDPARDKDVEVGRDDAELAAVSYTHLRAHETVLDLVCRLLLEKKKKTKKHKITRKRKK